ncbi:uncharacterized protein H6S33_008942 [Morchella sextelata]|uniref:uncharacterized protein n=1 Tax=Morchella sextelata TaxID=1174677 RepID=UPI001D03B301|nr:uncharacterized protein H6S33_008942 [Morchella sextelata]KAH0612562.1 hypothetical protein H6S33_008942 [Morchella sextelata]
MWFRREAMQGNWIRGGGKGLPMYIITPITILPPPHQSLPPFTHITTSHSAFTKQSFGALDHKLAPTALFYSPAPEQLLPSPHHLLHPTPNNDSPRLPSISRTSSISPLPSLNTLASVALPSPPLRLNGGFAMTFATSSPGASTAGQGTTPPICQNCTTSTTPLWRRDESGSVLCNACGLFLKLHGRPRPISLKTDVIKSRNRVKNSGQPAKKKSLFDSPNGSTNGHPIARSENGTPPPGHRKPSSGATSNRSVSPQSRAGTPLPPTSHIAPPSIFESLVNHADNSVVGSPSPLPGLNSFNHPSPGSTSSLHDRHMEQPTPTLDSLMSTNSKLKTRVAELELVNDLFRTRVNELEQSEANARQKEITRREVEAQLRVLLSDSTKREEELKRKLEDAERELNEFRGDHQRKKVRVSDLTE